MRRRKKNKPPSSETIAPPAEKKEEARAKSPNPAKGKNRVRKLSDDDDEKKEPKDEKETLTAEERKKVEERISSSILYVTNSTEFDQKMYARGYIPFGNGVVDGITGGLLCEMVESPVPVTIFLVSADMRYPDAVSAVTVVQAVDALFPHLKIDLKPLSDKAKFLQNTIAKIQRTMAEKNTPAPNSMYT